MSWRLADRPFKLVIRRTIDGRSRVVRRRYFRTADEATAAAAQLVLAHGEHFEIVAPLPMDAS